MKEFRRSRPHVIDRQRFLIDQPGGEGDERGVVERLLDVVADG